MAQKIKSTLVLTFIAFVALVFYIAFNMHKYGHTNHIGGTIPMGFVIFLVFLWAIWFEKDKSGNSTESSSKEPVPAHELNKKGQDFQPSINTRSIIFKRDYYLSGQLMAKVGDVLPILEVSNGVIQIQNSAGQKFGIGTGAIHSWFNYCDDKPTKTCHMCGEEILFVARKCKHCHEILS